MRNSIRFVLRSAGSSSAGHPLCGRLTSFSLHSIRSRRLDTLRKIASYSHLKDGSVDASATCCEPVCHRYADGLCLVECRRQRESTEHHFGARGRHGLRRPWLLWRSRADSKHRSTCSRRNSISKLLCELADLFAFPNGFDHRTISAPTQSDFVSRQSPKKRRPWSCSVAGSEHADSGRSTAIRWISNGTLWKVAHGRPARCRRRTDDHGVRV